MLIAFKWRVRHLRWATEAAKRNVREREASLVVAIKNLYTAYQAQEDLMNLWEERLARFDVKPCPSSADGLERGVQGLRF